MRTGQMLYPDERQSSYTVDLAPPAPQVTATPPPLVTPNAKIGAELVAKHGGVEQAMMAYQPDSPEFDHIQAYRYVSTGKRPPNWIPAIVRPRRPE
jgi:hypothetical protein